MSIILEGYLQKQGSITSKNWHSRYFVLQNNLLLRFDEKPASSRHPGEAKESINLTGCSILRAGYAPKNYAFSINGSLGREICVLAAPDHESMMNWINLLTAATAKTPAVASQRTVLVVQPPTGPVQPSPHTTIIYQQHPGAAITHSYSTSHLQPATSGAQYPGNAQPPTVRSLPTQNSAPQLQYAQPPQQYAPPPPQQYSQQPPQQYSQPSYNQTPQQYAPPPAQHYSQPPQGYAQGPPPQQYSQPPTQQYSQQPPQQYSQPPPSQYSQPQYSQPPPQQYAQAPPQSQYQQPAQQYSQHPPSQYSQPPPSQYSQPPSSQYSQPPPSQPQSQHYAQSAPPPSQYSQPPAALQPPSAPPNYYNTEPSQNKSSSALYPHLAGL